MQPDDVARLDAALLKAHAEMDYEQLVSGYTSAADAAEDCGDTARASFFLTQAWVFAMDAGDLRAADLKARLVAFGSEV